MDRIDLRTVIQGAISRINRTRIGDKPPVFATLPPVPMQVPWPNRSLKEFARHFLYESLLKGDPDDAIEISLHHRLELKDLAAFLGVKPSYWVQLSVSGRELRIVEQLIESWFFEVGYGCEEWVGVASSNVRLGIFDAIGAPTQKMLFCLESSGNVIKCDLLLPIADNSTVSNAVAQKAGA